MDFRLPQLPEDFRGAWSLRISVVMQLERTQATRILDAVDPEMSADAHSAVVSGAELNGRHFEFQRILGVHAGGENDEDGAVAHLDLRLGTDAKPDDRASGVEWGALFGRFAAEVPRTVAAVSAYWRFPRELASFGVELPIPLDDLAGFSGIAGVRLAENDPDSGEELYSLILDEVGNERSAQVATTLELQTDSEMLQNAWERVVSIAGLAVDPPIPGEESDD